MRRFRLGVLAILLALVAWFGFQAYHIFYAVRVTTGVQVPRPTNEPTVAIPPLDGNKRLNFLVLGSDNDKKKEEARPLSQSMIIVTVDPRNAQVGILSIPRDFWVPIPRHGYGKIDLAYKYGGVSLARETVERLFHIPIHYYAWVGLNGFIKAIDTFGGLTLDVSHPILDDTYPDDLNTANPYAYKRIFIPAGWQHMDGSRALNYVRSRHGDLIGDFGRSSRQQDVLLQLREKMNAVSILQHITSLVQELQGSVKTDLTVDQLYELDQISHRIQPGSIRQVVLQAPTYSQYGWAAGQSIVQPNWKAIRPVIAQMFAPIPPAPPNAAVQRLKSSQPATPTPTPHRAPATVSAHASVMPVPTPTPTATPTPAAPRLRGSLLYIQGGNLFRWRPGGGTSQLTMTGDVAMAAPSPDGRSVALVRFYRFREDSDIWLLDLRTHKEHPITNNSASDVRNNLWAAWPSWSPDGSHLVFSTDRAKLALPPSEIRPVDLAIWSMGSSGTAAVQLTDPAKGSGGDTDPTWRPASSLFAFIKWNYAQPSNQPYSQLALRDTISGREWLLTPPGGRVLQPAWDRTGRRLTFVRLTNGIDEIAVAPVVKNGITMALGRRIVIAQGRVAQPAFSVDGKWVSYLRADGDHFRLYVTPATGGPSVALDTGGDLDARWRPVWIP